MTDIIDFLQARLDEDERVALDAYGAQWEVGPTFGALNNRVYVREKGDLIDSVGTCVIAGQVSNVPQFRANAQHIARWDPARVLAEVEAKRRIIDECKKLLNSRTASSELDWAPDFLTHDVLCLLAVCYRDHPDYDAAWALDTV